MYVLGCLVVVAVMLSAVEPRRSNYPRHTATVYYNKFFGSEYCRLSKMHTMCQYREVGPKCGRRLGGGVSIADQTDILEAHNKYRQKVAQGHEYRGSPGPQPRAADMRELVWDEELARVAQRWADQCTYAHDAQRGVRRFDVGQNVYAWSTTGDAEAAPEWMPVVRSLYEEVILYNSREIAPFEWKPATSHYTQIVWAKTTHIGCGYTMYRKEGERLWTDKLYVCNYGPCGNVANGAVYRVGPPCSQCPNGTSSGNPKYPALCSVLG